MEQDSLWLGPLRGPIKLAMIGFGALTGILFVILIGMHFVSDTAYGMHEMIRPEGRPLVQVTLICIGLALLFTSLYLSDEKGSIEPDHTGPFDILSLVLSRLAMVSIALVVIVMFYEVVARYVFSAPTLWANEMSLWIAAFVFLLAGQYAMQQRSHIRIYIIYDMMPRWAQKAADSFTVLLIWTFVFCLIWGSYTNIMTRWNRMEGFGTAWDPPINGTVHPAILVISILVALQALSNLIADWNKEPEIHTDEPDAEEIEAIRRTLEDPK
ncbi:TRAP transporter small permease subunit [Tropicibacter alexandrii]|uniref:TRAP transporter small permease subunit n=1 Tax=Tropicibacter alexandrii TaxID=2267683 RepID=UPI000EF4AE72|nr:TRAP transporter small permease [Tropicibacter alexandrii]